MFNNDFFDSFNNLFANMDNVFRDYEKRVGVPSLLPLVTVPTFKNKVDRRITSVTKDGVTRNFLDGMLHCETGPAVIYEDDRQDEYWLEGVKVTKEQVEEHKQKLEDDK